MTSSEYRALLACTAATLPYRFTLAEAVWAGLRAAGLRQAILGSPTPRLANGSLI